MPNKPGFREVYVEVDANLTVGNFGGEEAKSPSYVVRVSLSEEALQLKGEAFARAARAAFKGVLIGDAQVYVRKNLFAEPEPVDPECSGYKISPENLVIRDVWYPADS